MVTKNQIKLIKSLHQKKYRKTHQLFIAEGVKVIKELLSSDFALEHLYYCEDIDFGIEKSKQTKVSKEDIKKMSALITTPNCLAVFHCAKERNVSFDHLVLALDDIRDPGNLGTIIRLCDWFGIEHLLCSQETVDVYNPKVVQATMGSITRVNIVYGDLLQLLKDRGEDTPVYGTFMDGDNIYTEKLGSKGVIVMGNEANGISSEIEAIVTQRMSIPRFGNLQLTESLNVATAASIILSEFKRTTI
ncbi:MULTISPECIES: RNA methyltransferase [Myroides]|uniref:RNA methyltransferase n=1 Tax=Myroides albus TaxID=2562892 RepID=A0A6I3LHM7_9FLAO|nr:MULTISPECIES: RNA methyltransferase [Myroides]MTG97086.1 RNA methyltransferase [Myroides albus]MVX36825.1 RNA methyltransferase [Myroides sp. LoEW2-1]UVD78491.1 RNA methyltransferase [Myroides albus]